LKKALNRSLDFLKFWKKFLIFFNLDFEANERRPFQVRNFWMLWPGVVDDPYKKRPFWDMKTAKAELERKQNEDYNRREAKIFRILGIWV